MDKWEFKKIFDVHDKQMDEHGLIYYIKWKYYSEETWEFKKSLKGYEHTLFKFYK